MGINPASNARDQAPPTSGTYYPRTEDSCHTKSLRSRHLALQGAGAQYSAGQPCSWRAYSSESPPLTVSPSGSNTAGLPVALLALAIVGNSILISLTCSMSVSQPLQTVWSVKAGVGHHHLRCSRNLSSLDGWVGGRKDSWKDGEMDTKSKQRLREGNGAC